MSKEEYMDMFHAIGSKYLFEANVQRTRYNIIQEFTVLMNSLIENRDINQFLGRFIDRTSLEEIYRGDCIIIVKFSDETEMTIEEFCEYLSKNEQYLK